MDAVQSGTGVFYQAIPAIGADGKNIMKLMPVQMVNGQFFRTPISKPKTDPTPQKTITISIPSSPVPAVKKATLNPSASQQVVRNQFSLMNASPYQVCLDPSNSINKHSLQQPTVKLMAKVVQMASPATSNCETSGRLPGQLSETVQSPALPRGLQIPPNAQMRKIPTSEPPPGIKKAGISANQGDSACHSLNLLSKTSSTTSCGPPSKGSKKHLKLVPAVSQRPNSPIKWMVEEEESSTAPTLNPLHSPSVTSEILSAVAEREKASKQCRDVSAKPVPQLNQGSGAGHEKATFACNGKVFFVVKSDSLPPKVGKSDLPTAETKSYEFNKMEVPSSKPSAATETGQHIRIIIPGQSDDVIDLCDEDEKDDSSQQAQVTHWDEDNVIFVSYIPPKSESGPARNLILKQTDQMETHRQASATEQKCLDGPTGTGALGRRKPENIVRKVNNRKISCQQSVATQQLESTDVETERPADRSPSDGSSRVCSLIGKDIHKMESSTCHTTSLTSSLAPKSCQMADHALKQMFGITADVKICLQRIDEASDGFTWAVEDHHDSMGGLKKCPLQNLNSPQDTDSLVSVKRVKLLNTKPLSAFKYHSGQSSLRGTSCDVEDEPVIGYVEPIDDDILSTEEKDIPDSQDCVDLNTNTRRMGRTRKRTFCPCCIPGTQVPAARSSPNWACQKEQMSKKGGRTKAVRKAFKTSGGISFLTAKNRQQSKTCESPARDSLSTVSMDSDELIQEEQIRQLRELLREKEAALELMRNSTS